MRYAHLTDFKRKYFGDSTRPSLSKLRRLCANAALPCRRIGNDWFIDIPAFEANGDPLLAKILCHVPGTS